MLMSYRSSTMERVFDKTRVHDVQQSIVILAGMMAVAMFLFVAWAMFECKVQSAYWVASIASGILISIQTWVAFYLYKNVNLFDKDVTNKTVFMKKMKLQDILSLVTVVTCIVGIITAGWLGFTFEQISKNEAEHSTLTKDEITAVNERAERNGQIAGALLGLNTGGIMTDVLVVWANYKFRAYLRTQEANMSPEEYEAHVINLGMI